MCKFNSKMGFTLIELMVVIVIIGVLASLAIPRFTEASDKAKVAEVPRILASYESAQLAHVAERGYPGASDDIIFDVSAISSDSKWFNYTVAGGGTASATGSIAGGAAVKIGQIPIGGGLQLGVDDGGIVTRTIFGGVTADLMTKKYTPNFFKNAAPAAGGGGGGEG